VCKRLALGVRLFYAELGALPQLSYRPQTSLRSILSATLDNYQEKGLSCRHETSREVLKKYEAARPYTASKSSGATLADYIGSSKKFATPPAKSTPQAPIEQSKKPSNSGTSWAKAASSTRNPTPFFTTHHAPASKKEDYPPLSQQRVGKKGGS